MQTADLIQKILEEKNLTRADLAGMMGVNQSQITRWLAGSVPGMAACLLLAGLAESDQERVFWIHESKMTRSQIASIAAAVGAETPTVLSAEETALLAWWHNPCDAMEKSIRDLVEQLLKVRAV
jgi:transcriptional regulator with XRE-family HTH domain